jgi:hypothetical protein
VEETVAAEAAGEEAAEVVPEAVEGEAAVEGEEAAEGEGEAAVAEGAAAAGSRP